MSGIVQIEKPTLKKRCRSRSISSLVATDNQNIGGLLSVGGGLDTGGCDEPFDGADCVPDVPAGVAMLPGADAVGAAEVPLLCVAPEAPPLEPGVPGAVPITDPCAPAPLPIELPLTTSSTLRFC